MKSKVIVVSDKLSPKQWTFKNEKSLNKWLKELQGEIEDDTREKVSLRDLKTNYNIYSSYLD